MLIPNLFSFYTNFASKEFKNSYKYFWSCVCVRNICSSLFCQSPEKNLAFRNYFFKNIYQIIFLMI
jgi:hypothetical protein